MAQIGDSPLHYHASGWHVLADFYDCDALQLMSPDRLMRALVAGAHAAGAQIVGEHCHHFGEQQGVTAVLLLQESHMSIHTWPEEGFIALDIFMCGDAQSDAALAVLMTELAPKRHTIQKIQRGLPLKQPSIPYPQPLKSSHL